MFTKRSYTVLTLSFALFCLLLSAGCGGKTAAPEPDVIKRDLIGKVWECESLCGREIVGENPITLEFMEDGTVKGSGGCNTFTGRYVVAAAAITFSELASTRKACGPGVDEQEYSFMGFMRRVKGFHLSSSELELIVEEAPEPMVFGTGGGFLW